MKASSTDQTRPPGMPGPQTHCSYRCNPARAYGTPSNVSRWWTHAKHELRSLPQPSFLASDQQTQSYIS